eukprot:1079555_1
MASLLRLICCIVISELCSAEVLNQIGRFYIENIGFPGPENVAIDTNNNHMFAADPSSIAVNILSYTLSSDLSYATISFQKAIDLQTVFDELLPDTNTTLSDVPSIAYSPTGYVVAAVIPEDHAITPGWLAFITLDTLEVFHLLQIDLCYDPDHISITSDGSRIIVACEGEPDDNEAEFPSHNPPGSMAIIDVSSPNINEWTFHDANFERFDADEYQSLIDELYITHQYEPFSVNVEPEYSAISDDDRYAYVSLQEQNAIAVLDIKQMEIIDIYPLGTNDYSIYGLDASDKDDAINIQTYPNLYGMRAPDSIDYLLSNKKHYLFTANEGDTKDFDEIRVEDAILSDITFGDYNTTELQQKEHLGRLKVTNLYGKNEEGEYESLYAFSSRDFTIWEVQFDEDKKPSGIELIYSSNNMFELITADKLGIDGFNSGYYSPSFDERSDAKGPEPESLVVGECGNGRKYVFIGMERVGGIFVFDISKIDEGCMGCIQYVEYFNSRNFTVTWEEDTRPPENAGDVGPEQMRFIDESVYGAPLLFVTYPESSSIAMYRID